MGTGGVSCFAIQVSQRISPSALFRRLHVLLNITDRFRARRHRYRDLFYSK
jgi:hypothetical protein